MHLQLLCLSTSLKITQAFHLLLGYVENLTVFWGSYIHNSVRITEGLDNGGSDNRGSTVHVIDYKDECSQIPVTGV